MYTRIKKIKGIEYAYLVKSNWSKRKKTSKQKTLKYLGRVYRFKKSKNQTIEKYLKLKDLDSYFLKKPVKQVIISLIQLELFNHNFKELKKNIWVNKDIVVNFKEKKIYNQITKKQTCVEINNNFLSNKTLRNLISLKVPPGLTNLQIGNYLANSFLSAGVTLSQDKFVVLSRRILAKINKI